MNRLFRALALSLLVAGCASTVPPTKPTEKEWTQLTTEFQSLVTLRNSARRASASSTRKERIEVLLENHKNLEPVTVLFFDKVEEYYNRTGDPRAARLYAGEKIRMADEYMNVLARYDRAINLYQRALTLDPENVEARAKLQVAQAKRFMTTQSFQKISPGMRQDIVQQLIGMPREDWIKQVIQGGRTYSVWIYPKADGGAAAIYFNEGIVYSTNWTAAPAGKTSQ